MRQFADYTASGELHPALKTYYVLHCEIYHLSDGFGNCLFLLIHRNPIISVIILINVGNMPQ